MRLLAGAGVVAFFLVGLSVGVRLLALWRRSRQLPELLAALAFLCLGPLAFTLSVSGSRLAVATPELARVFAAAASASAGIGSACAAAFTIVVFRPESRLARAAVGALAAALAVCWMGVGVTNGFDVRLAPGGFRYAGQLLRLAILFWASLEALVYWSFMRRRRAFGLADPIVTNRVALWGVGMGMGATALAIGFFGSNLRSAGYTALFEASIAASGLVASASLLLAFQPPARYRAFISGRAGAARVT
jgi:hypothetical protein